MRKTCVRRGIGSIAMALGIAVVIALANRTARAQDPVKVAPNNYKVILENDTVRVAEVKAKPGDKIGTHSHPDHLVYAVNGGKVKFTFPDGKTKEVELKAGEATWIKAETHATENVGANELKLALFELKKPAPAKPTAPKISDADDQAKVAKETTKVLLENDRVRVMDSRLAAGGKLAKHSHPAHVVYALTEGKVRGTNYPEIKTEEKSIAVGQALWGDAVSHAVENIGKGELHVVVVEIKD